MRKLVVIVVLVIFGAYCFLAHEARTWYAVPEYETKTVDILGGASIDQWNREIYASKRYDRLSSLSRERLQPVRVPQGAEGLGLSPDRPLERDDYEALVEAGITELEVRDPAALIGFADRRLRARQPATQDGDPVVREGAVLDKATLDRLLDAGIERVAVVGAGDVVGFNATVWMVILIFIGMTAALTDIFWEPMTELIDRRTAEVREGAQCMRTNRLERERIDRERREELRAIHHEYQDRLRAARRETFTEVDRMTDKAFTELKNERERVDRELRKALAEAEAALRDEAPALAREVAARLRS